MDQIPALAAVPPSRPFDIYTQTFQSQLRLFDLRLEATVCEEKWLRVVEENPHERNVTLAHFAREIESFARKLRLPSLDRRFMRSFLINASRRLFGWPPEPSSATTKQELVASFARDAPNLVETGTFQGDMIEAQRERFVRLVTIEVVDDLWAAARQRFSAFPHISVLHGDSGQLLSEAITLFEGPAVFWLDGHFSGGETGGDDENLPVLKELATIAARDEPHDVLLIDDARLFGWRRGYPRLSVVEAFASKHWPRHRFFVESDVIQIVPR